VYTLGGWGRQEPDKSRQVSNHRGEFLARCGGQRGVQNRRESSWGGGGREKEIPEGGSGYANRACREEGA
jgi:hypothetical protein